MKADQKLMKRPAEDFVADEKDQASLKYKKMKQPSDTAAARLDRQSQKELLVQRKTKKIPAYAHLVELKKCWEQIRLKRLSKADRQRWVSQSMAKLGRGQVMDLIFKHDASRIVQCLLKFADAQKERPRLFEELKGHYVELAQSPYGRFVVLKALKYAPNAAVRSQVTEEFLNKDMSKLLKHKYAGYIVDTIYCLYATVKERQAMHEHFYGADYLVLKKCMPTLMISQKEEKTKKKPKMENKRVTLETIMEQFPDKRERLLKQMKERLVPLIGKDGTVGSHELLHRAVLDLMLLHDSVEALQQLVLEPTSLLHPLLAQIPTFIHTKPGCQIAMLLLTVASAKERKIMLKAMKPHIRAICCNEYGWMVLHRVLESVDDTVLVQKCILNEIMGKSDKEFSEVVTNRHCQRLLILLLAGADSKVFSPDLIKALNMRSEWLKLTTKKDATARRQELSGALLDRLASVFDAYPRVSSELLRDLTGSHFLLVCMSLKASDQPIAMQSVLSQAAELLVLPDSELEVPAEEKVESSSEDEDEDEKEEEQEDEAEEGEEKEKELEISKHYVQSKKAEAPIRKCHVLLDSVATRSLKRFSKEIPTFAARLVKTLVDVQTVENLFQLDLEKLQPGPFFVFVSLIEKLDEEKENEDLLKQLKQQVKMHAPAQAVCETNKGLKLLLKTIM